MKGDTGAGYSGVTSTTSFTVCNSLPCASQTITITAGSAFETGSRVRVSSTANPSNVYVEGVATVSGTSMSIAVDRYKGGGTTAASWRVSIAGDRGEIGLSGPQGPQGEYGEQLLGMSCIVETTPGLYNWAEISPGSGIWVMACDTTL